MSLCFLVRNLHFLKSLARSAFPVKLCLKTLVHWFGLSCKSVQGNVRGSPIKRREKMFPSNRDIIWWRVTTNYVKYVTLPHKAASLLTNPCPILGGPYPYRWVMETFLLAHTHKCVLSFLSDDANYITLAYLGNHFCDRFT